MVVDVLCVVIRKIADMFVDWQHTDARNGKAVSTVDVVRTIDILGDFDRWMCPRMLELTT